MRNFLACLGGGDQAKLFRDTSECDTMSPMKKIVAHINPDLDAVVAVWLIKRFLPGWEGAEIDFCEPQSTIDGRPADSNPDILHVDVGGGKLDHHQTGEYLSAAKLCFDYLKQQRKEQSLKELDEKALVQIIKVVTEVDNARDLNWPEAKTSRPNFYLHSLIAGIRGMAGSDEETMIFGSKGMDAVFHQIKKSIDAQEELKEGIEFRTPWGKAIAVETGNDNVLWEGEKKGYCLVVRKDPESGGVRIYGRWDKGVDLTEAYNQVRKKDPESKWFLHASKKLLLNMSTKKKMKPTRLNLEEIMKILRRD